MERITESPQTQSRSLYGFFPILGLSEVLGSLVVILVLVWTYYFRGGFSWRSNPTLEFNWHPLLMTIALVFLYANAMLIYRVQPNLRKKQLKLFHAGMMFLIVFLMVFALITVFDSHNLATPDPIPNMYSLHSWVGLTTVILFCCQWLTGFVTFLFPGLHVSLRTSYMPIHVYFGVAGFIGAIASCLLGLNEKAIFTLQGKYSAFDGEGVLINIIGLLLISFGGLSVYLVTQSQYRRLPMPEEVLLSGTG